MDAGINTKNCIFSTQYTYVQYLMRLALETATLSLYSIHRLVFLIEGHYVLCEAWAESFYVT